MKKMPEQTPDATRTAPTGEKKQSSAMPAVLGLIAGMVDVTSWLTIGGLFAAHITGNLVVVAADWVQGKSPRPTQILAIPVFILGVALADFLLRRFAVRSTGIKSLFFAQFALLACAAVLAAIIQPSTNPNSFAATLVGMTAVTAMAVQNTLLHFACKPTPTVAVMTGNIVVCTLALINMILDRGDDRSDAVRQWKATFPILLGFLAGCFAGAFAVSLFQDLAWILPASTSMALLVVTRKHTQQQDDID